MRSQRRYNSLPTFPKYLTDLTTNPCHTPHLFHSLQDPTSLPEIQLNVGGFSSNANCTSWAKKIWVTIMKIVLSLPTGKTLTWVTAVWERSSECVFIWMLHYTVLMCVRTWVNGFCLPDKANVGWWSMISISTPWLLRVDRMSQHSRHCFSKDSMKLCPRKLFADMMRHLLTHLLIWLFGLSTWYMTDDLPPHFHCLEA